MNTIYTVTVLTDIDTRRLVAMCTAIQSAMDIVETNEMDIREDEYQYAVIERVATDIAYGMPHNPWMAWYSWDGQRYVAIAPPPHFKHIINFWE
jgi:hypothetical protein